MWEYTSMYRYGGSETISINISIIEYITITRIIIEVSLVIFDNNRNDLISKKILLNVRFVDDTCEFKLIDNLSVSLRQD